MERRPSRAIGRCESSKVWRFAPFQGRPERVEWTSTRNLPDDDPNHVAALMEAIASQNRQKKPQRSIASRNARLTCVLDGS